MGKQTGILFCPSVLAMYKNAVKCVVLFWGKVLGKSFGEILEKGKN